MKIERLIKGSPDCPLVRLFDFTSTEVESLRKGVRGLADREYDRLDLAEQLGVISVGDFMLSFAVGQRDVGLASEGFRVVWVLRPESWDIIEGLIKPFINDATAFQWLSEIGETSLLLSRSGRW